MVSISKLVVSQFEEFCQDIKSSGTSSRTNFVFKAQSKTIYFPHVNAKNERIKELIFSQKSLVHHQQYCQLPKSKPAEKSVIARCNCVSTDRFQWVTVML